MWKLINWGGQYRLSIEINPFSTKGKYVSTEIVEKLNPLLQNSRGTFTVGNERVFFEVVTFQFPDLEQIDEYRKEGQKILTEAIDKYLESKILYNIIKEEQEG